ncbi:hypothetical protein AZE42_04850 [Rhizopogon vesiculosus]|uniref:Uncharacterized protein n=1 Tax=Rhizopogon vesiculosus TaxID=180088 RepID=A0A1J8Q4R5_9AGAM|nr:hypothetical protein AZE42_04850 [Rhizopogon vesiculosus]
MVIKNTFNRKMCPHYLGPLIVLARNKGATYRVVPYFACKSLPLPNLSEFIDISLNQFQALKDAQVSDPDAPDEESDVDEEDTEETDAYQLLLCARHPQQAPPLNLPCSSTPVPGVDTSSILTVPPIVPLIKRQPAALALLQVDMPPLFLCSPLFLISEAVAQRYQLAIDCNHTLTMTAPTGADVSTTGLAANVPISLEGLAFVVQFYVLDHSLFDVILGQPFFVLAEATIAYQNAGTVVIKVSYPVDLRHWQLPASSVPSPVGTHNTNQHQRVGESK